MFVKGEVTVYGNGRDMLRKMTGLTSGKRSVQQADW